MANPETKQSENQDQINTKDFIIGALVGGLVGAATALFLTPKTGKELRHEVGTLKGKTDQLRISATQKGNNLAAATKEKTIQLREIAVEKGSLLAETVKEKTDKIRSLDLETSEETQPQIEE